MKIVIAILATLLLAQIPPHIKNTQTVVTKPEKVQTVSKSPRRKKIPKVKKLTVIKTCEQAYPLLARYFGDDIRIAKAVMQAESGCNSRADNTGTNTDGSNDVGLMQINSVHCPHLIRCSDRTNPEKNLQAARQIYNSSGWSAWSTFNNGSYTRYLK